MSFSHWDELLWTQVTWTERKFPYFILWHNCKKSKWNNLISKFENSSYWNEFIWRIWEASLFTLTKRQEEQRDVNFVKIFSDWDLNLFWKTVMWNSNELYWALLCKNEKVQLSFIMVSSRSCSLYEKQPGVTKDCFIWCRKLLCIPTHLQQSNFLSLK